MTPEEWREQVGRHVERARAQRSVRSVAKLAGISEGLWRQIESGRRPLRRGAFETVHPRESTRAAVGDLLWGDRYAIDRLLRGEEPVEVETVSSRDVERVDRLQAQVAELRRQFEDQARTVAAQGVAIEQLEGQLRRRGDGSA